MYNRKITKMTKIPIKIPMNAIYSRLGRHRHRCEILPEQRRFIEENAQKAFELCHFQACYRRCEIVENSGNMITLSSGATLGSCALAKLLQNSRAVFLMGATAGKELSLAIKQLIADSAGAAALVYDATGSESVDAVLDYLTDYLKISLARRGERLTKNRFSCGYQDLPLSEQGKFYEQLNLADLGVVLSENFIFEPEKSVTAIIGIEALCG